MKTIVILSGGMDSTTVLYKALSETKDVKALGFNYGQKHSKELAFASQLCQELEIDYKVVDISGVKKLLNSSLTSSEEIPEGHYAEDNMKSTVVPNRNAIMLSIAYGYAISEKADKIMFGAHTGDHFIYPDCRPEFVEKLNKALKSATEGLGETIIEAPYLDKTKADIVAEGITLGVPYYLTWSCYKGNERPCLKCGTCVERTEAFVKNGIKDSLLTVEEWVEALKYLNQVTK